MTPLTPTTPLPFSVLDAEDITTLDDSTAPTTPDGSSSFSPNLRPQDDAGYLNVSSLSAAIAAAAPAVRNICFIGAGFVGKLLPCAFPSLPASARFVETSH
jgi:UDPglucose 6-dehydrogenase